MRQWLAPTHLALTLVIIIWNVVLSGRIAQMRQATKPFAILTGFAGLLMLPAFIVAIATTTMITGRAISAIDWLWPVTILLFAVQSVYALVRRLVHPLFGYPIAFYNVLIMVAELARYLTAHGFELAQPLLVVMAAEVDALALATTDAAIASPFYLHVPLVSPAFPSLSRASGVVRGVMTALALGWFAFIVAEMPRANIALESYAGHSDDRLRERLDGFRVGVKVFPDVSKAPSGAALSTDLRLVEFLNANVVSVTVVPGASMVAIDSIARALEILPRDSTLLIATIGYRGKLLPEIRRERLDPELRLRTLHRVLERLRPDIVLPAQDPYGVGARVLGELSVEEWQRFFTQAAALVQQVRPRTQVALAASSFDSRDSTLFAWAAAPGSPIEVVGFSVYPNRLGARAMNASLRAADRWMRASESPKPHWVFGTGGYPLAHGEVSQELAVWGALAWATEHQRIRGLVVTEANDYGRAMGLRAPNGRFRGAAGSVARAIRGMREAATRAVPGVATEPGPANAQP